MIVDCESERPNEFPQTVHLRKHVFRADVMSDSGSTDSAPGPHDYFDTALATCKALTAIWFAKKNAIPLERVESHVERDDGEERKGIYTLKVRLAFHGPLTDEQRTRLFAAVERCPIHKLMTTSEVRVVTAPLETGAGA